MLWKSIKHYPDSRLLLVIFLITPGVFWAWENTFHFSCFPSSQTKKATRDTFPSCYVWIPLGKWGRLSGLFLKQQPKVNSKMWTLRSHPATGRREFSNVPLMFWWLLGFSYQTWPCPHLLSKENIAHAIIRKLKECQIYCFSLFVIVFMLLNVCMWRKKEIFLSLLYLKLLIRFWDECWEAWKLVWEPEPKVKF